MGKISFLINHFYNRKKIYKMTLFNKYILLANLYKTEIKEFTDKIQNHNNLFNTESFLEYAYKNIEKIIYKVFITELRQNANFIDTLANMKDLIDSKYSGINQLVNNQLNTFFNSYVNVTNDISKSIHKLYNFYSNHKIIIEPVGDFHDNKFVAKISVLNQIYYYKPRLADLDECFIKVLQLLNPQVENIFAPIIDISNRCKIIEDKEYSLHSDLNQFDVFTTTPELNYYILSVLCLLGARDMHYGNFLQLGNIIYPIDFETLISPQINEIREYNQYTILCSLILPTISNSGLDFSLFGYDLQTEKDIDFFDIKNIYTDKMDFYVNKKIVFTNKINFSFELAIFKRIYNILAPIFAKNSAKIIDIFTKQEMLIRIIFRSTYLYSKLIESMSHPSICNSISAIKKYLINQLNNHNISQFPLPEELLNKEIEQLIHYNIPKIV
ncbi:MAG: DUF4135 domain-containing protein [Burkholderiales bacterium]|nr:DUF4135 domain-containing protein [Burkholderiales bacterium]